MIVSMRRLNFTCSEERCSAQAIFEIRTRNALSEDSLLALEQHLTYCAAHVPEEAQEWWDWMRT